MELKEQLEDANRHCNYLESLKIKQIKALRKENGKKQKCKDTQKPKHRRTSVCWGRSRI